MINVGVIGVTGYVGMEIVRILHRHPGINIRSIVSQNHVGQKLSDVYPNFKNVFEMDCQSLDLDAIANECDIFITALPHGISKEIIPQLVQKGKRVIDHSGDFRYKSVEVYEKWYKQVHGMPQLLDLAVYGLPELYRMGIKDSQIVSNPGCYPTCSILGIAPLLANKLIDTKGIIVDAVSGISGAGRKAELEYQFCECAENFKAYGVTNHRHTSEIEQEFGILADEEVMISFTPHLAPMKRGMLCTIYANINRAETTGDLIGLYKEYYKNEFFVRVLDEGKLPESKNVAGTNFVDIGIVVDKRLNRVVVLSAIDNLGKGAAGQAVQNLNIMCGFPETTALENPGLYL